MAVSRGARRRAAKSIRPRSKRFARCSAIARRRRDLLIEHLHLVQDRYGHISSAHLAALAAEMRLSQTEVYEVATFYAHFDVVKEGEDPPPPVTVRVCNSLTCAMAGADRLFSDLPKAGWGPGVRVVRAPCMGACDRAPVLCRRPRAGVRLRRREGVSKAAGPHLHTRTPGTSHVDFEHALSARAPIACSGERLLRRQAHPRRTD